MMAGLPERSLIERWFGSGFVGSVLIALVTQAIFSIIYQVSNNTQQAGAIVAVDERLTHLRNDIFNLNTPLSSRVILVEAQLKDLQREHTNMHAMIATIDTNGTRALSVITANQQRVMNQQERFADRLIATDKKLTDIESREGRGIMGLQSQVDIINKNVQRVDERIEQIMKSLNDIMAFIRAYSHNIPPPKLQGDSRPEK